MIRILIRKLNFIGILIFLVLFFRFYKSSGKFRRSIITAAVTITVYSSSLIPASAGTGDADAFTQQSQQHHSRSQHDQGIFGRKSSNDDSGAGKPDDDGSEENNDNVPNCPQVESVERTQDRVDKIHEHLGQMKEVSDSNTENEEGECSIEKIKVGVAEDGSTVNIDISQVRDKGLHIPDFLNAEILDGKFDVTKVRKLKYPDRLNYLRNKNNLPDELVYQARDKILDFMTAKDTKLIPGFLGASKIEGTVFINLRLKKVGLRDYGRNKFRTAMAMDK